MELNRDGSSGAIQPTRMFDHTGVHKYHVFKDDELLNDYSIKKLNRLVHGSNMDASDWTVFVANIREGSTTTMSHHCSMDGDHAKTAACFSDNLHQNYCPCWEYKDGVGWVRCGILQKVMSIGCSKHRDDESRKVFDKLRKKYAVYGRELNNPNLEPVEEAVQAEPSKDKLMKKVDEAIEKKLQNGGELDEKAYVHSQLKTRAEEKYREDVYRRKDTEVNRAQREAALTQDPTTTSDAKQIGGRHKARFVQEVAERGKSQVSIPELDEKAKNIAKSKGGKSIWNGQKEDPKQQESVGVNKENDLLRGAVSQTDSTAPNEPEKKGRFERAAAVMGIHRKPKEKTRDGSKKD